MTAYTDLTKHWDSLQKVSSAYILQDSQHPLDIYIGYDLKLQKTLSVISNEKIGIDLPSSESITVEINKRGNNSWVLSFHLTKIENNVVFMKLCWDIIESTKTVSNNRIQCIGERYLMWYNLMKNKRQAKLGESRIKGLIGELFYLKELINKFGCRKAVESWAGPSGADRDFIYDHTWCEVKSLQVSGTSVWISSLEQLDCQSEGILRLYFMDKTTSEDLSGISLKQIVDDVRTLLESDMMSRISFETQLYPFGYDDDEPRYTSLKFKLFKTVSYCVGKEFPKLTRDSIIPQISQAKYCINLATIEDFKIMEGNDGS
ncbi:MAG: PD-(D/E)XK motif protein [Bacilli bacterium]|nr:PD-(D/E)XK motif protein [Bacilli bacterium]